MVLVSTVSAEEVSITVDFPEPEVVRIDGRVLIQFPDTWNYGDPGSPAVPWRGVQVLLSPGEEVSDVRVVPGELKTLGGRFIIEPGQPQYPLSFEGPVTPVQRDPGIYESPSVYPDTPVGSFSTQFLCGHGIGAVSVCPLRYVPSTGEVSYYSRLQIQITTEPSERARRSHDRLLKTTLPARNRLARMVDNPQAMSEYAEGIAPQEGPSRGIVDSNDDYEYVIITSSAFAADFQVLADFKTARGVPATVVLMSDILPEYPGDDDPERIRNFIVDAYSGWGTQYVLLGGDDEIIPHRGLYAVAYGYVNDDIAADIYYGALDGTWNDDGDSRWGEVGEEDLIAEVHVGRAAIDNATEVQNFLNKTLMYQENPVLADCNQAIMLGELLWAEPTWGGDYKDEIRYGADTHGYSTTGFLGSDFLVSHLYDRDHGTWTKDAAIDSLNSGINLCNHLGHCSVPYALRMGIGDVDNSFTNDGTNHGFFVVYSQGCYCNSFDNRDEFGNPTDDCIAEHFTTVGEAAVVFVGNSRYGWGQHQSTNGSSQYFDRQFFDAILGEGITRVGDCNDDSKVDNIPFIDYGGNRWCYYELCVLGDPELDMWTAVPGVLGVEHPSLVGTGISDFAVVVNSAKAPVTGAKVCLLKEADIYDVEFTGPGGTAMFSIDPQSVGWMTVTVTKHDFVPAQSVVEVVLGTAPSPPTGLAAAAGDGAISLTWDANPEPDVDSYTIYRGALPAPTDSVASVLVPGTSFLDAPLINGITYYYRMKAVSASGEESGYSEEVQATPTKVQVITIDHTPLSNTDDSSGPYPVVANITTDELPLNPDSVVVVYDVEETGWQSAVMIATGVPDEYEGAIPAQPCGTSIDYYILAVDTDHHRATHPEWAPANYHSFAVNYQVIFADDCETDQGWTPGVIDDDAYVGRWVRCEPEETLAQPGEDHTPGDGILAFVTRCDTGSNQGSYDVDGGRTTLLSPVFDLSGYLDSVVRYYRWYSNDTGDNPQQDYWVVEATSDGDTWVALENTNLSNRSWVLAEFDIGSYVDLTDQVQFRFIASDYSPGSIVEAGVDDFQIVGCPDLGDCEPPSVIILAPNGGEVLVGGGGTPYPIRWASYDNTAVTWTEIHLSEDHGKTYSTMITSGPDVTSPYNWTIPDLDEPTCRIRVVCRDDRMNEGSDSSDGNFEIRSVTAVHEPRSAPVELTLRQNRPNPFNPLTEIEFGLPSSQQISLEVYSVEGRRVATLAQGAYDAAYHRVVWDGTDSTGAEVSSGVYFYRLVTEGRTLTRKMMLLK
jgi:hypothetical protein